TRFPIVFLLLLPQPPTSTLFPYTTLFRSRHAAARKGTPPEPRGTRRARRALRVHTVWLLLDGLSLVLVESRQVRRARRPAAGVRSEEHTSELQSRENLVCRLLLEKKKKKV